jgi:hypothetical protein
VRVLGGCALPRTSNKSKFGAPNLETRGIWGESQQNGCSTMKFGKQILKAQQLSTPEWESFWLNYKQLKVLIKSIGSKSDREDLSGGTIEKESTCNPQNLG